MTAPTDATEARAKALAAALPTVTDDEKYIAEQTPAGTAEAREWSRTSGRAARDGSEQNGWKEARNALDTRRLADSMRRGLRSVENIRRSNRELSGRLDVRALARGLAGARDIYRTQQTDAGLTTAVQIMLDASGSMNADAVLRKPDGLAALASRWSVALATCQAMLPALQRAGAKAAVAAFSGQSAQAYAGSADQHLGTVKTIKKFSERMSAAQFETKIAGRHATGGTPMMQEARWSRDQVQGQRVQRRVVIWLCDGASSDDTDALHAEFTRQRAAGVENYAVGIQHERIARTFGIDYSLNVDDLAELPEAIRIMLEKGYAKA